MSRKLNNSRSGRRALLIVEKVPPQPFTIPERQQCKTYFLSRKHFVKLFRLVKESL